MNDDTKAGKGKVSFVDYIRVIDDYLIPFLGSYSIGNIDSRVLDKFDAWRTEQMGKAPTVARMGGDEFVVLLNDMDADKAESTLQAGNIAEKIRAALAEPYELTLKHEGQADAMVEHQCTASIGVVVFIDNEGSQEDFLKWADSAMYRAKDAGSNSIRFSKADNQS